MLLLDGDKRSSLFCRIVSLTKKKSFMKWPSDLQSMEQIRRIMRPTDVPDTGKTALDQTIFILKILFSFVTKQATLMRRKPPVLSRIRDTLLKGKDQYS